MTKSWRIDFNLLGDYALTQVTLLEGLGAFKAQAEVVAWAHHHILLIYSTLVAHVR